MGAGIGLPVKDRPKKMGETMEIFLAILTVLGVLAKTLLCVWLILIFSGMASNVQSIKDRLEAASKDQDDSV